jgi:hypothetical protein
MANTTEKISIQEYRRLTKKSASKQGGKKVSKGHNLITSLEIALKQQNVMVRTEYVFHPTRKWRFDLALPKYKIAVEYEGVFSQKSRHTTVSGYTQDCDKYNEGTELGWQIIRVTAGNTAGLYQRIMRMIHAQDKQQLNNNNKPYDTSDDDAA